MKSITLFLSHIIILYLTRFHFVTTVKY